MGHLGAFRRADNILNPLPFRSSLWAMGHLGAFRRAENLKRLSSSKFPVALRGILGLFAEQTKCQTSILFEVPYGAFAKHTNSQKRFLFEVPYGPVGHLGAFPRTDKISNALPLRSSLWGVLGLFAAQNLKRPSSSKFPMGRLGAFRSADKISNALPLRSSLWGVLGLFAAQTKSQTPFLFEVPYGASWGFSQRRQNLKRTSSSSKFPMGRLGAFSAESQMPFVFQVPYGASWGFSQRRQNLKRPSSSLWGVLGLFAVQTKSQTPFLFEVPYGASWGFSQRRISNALPLRSSLWGVLGLFAAQNLKCPSSSKFPYGASWGFSQRRQNLKRPSSSKFPMGRLGAFSADKISNALPLPSSLWGVSTPFLFPMGRLGAFRSADTISNALPLRSSLWGVLGFFAVQNLKRPSSSKFPMGRLGAFRSTESQTPFLFQVLGLFAAWTKSQTPFLFEVPCGASWGFSQCRQNLKRPSSSKFPVGRLGVFRSADKISSALPLRSSLWGVLGLFAVQTKSQTPFLFEVPCGASWGFSQRGQNLKRPSSSKFPVGRLGAFRSADKISNALPLRSSLWGVLGLFAAWTKSQAPFLFEVPFGASWGFSQCRQNLKRPSSSKFPVGRLGAFRSADKISNALPLRSSLWGVLGLFAVQTKSQTPFLFEVPCGASWGFSQCRQNLKRPSSSKFPVGRLGAFRSADKISNALPLRSSLWGVLGLFAAWTESRGRVKWIFALLSVAFNSQFSNSRGLWARVMPPPHACARHGFRLCGPFSFTRFSHLRISAPP